MIFFPSTASHTTKIDNDMAGGVKAIGSTWLTQYKGKEWPVVLCDDKRTPPAFFESRPSPFLCPAILLGKRIL